MNGAAGGRPALFTAIQNRNAALAASLLRAGAHGGTFYRGRSALWDAMCASSPAVVSVLLRHGMSPMWPITSNPGAGSCVCHARRPLAGASREDGIVLALLEAAMPWARRRAAVVCCTMVASRWWR
jgi:hypothetical protein